MNLRTLCAAAALLVSANAAGDCCDCSQHEFRWKVNKDIRVYTSPRDLVRDAINADSLWEAKEMLPVSDLNAHVWCAGPIPKPPSNNYESCDKELIKQALHTELDLWVAEHGSRDALQEKIDSANWKATLSRWASRIGVAGYFGGLGVGSVFAFFGNRHGNKVLEMAKSPSITSLAPDAVVKLNQDAEACSINGSMANKCLAVGIAGGVICVAGLCIANAYNSACKEVKQKIEKLDRIEALLRYLD